jgi:transcriptional regulator with XRE-family HTH domain
LQYFYRNMRLGIPVKLGEKIRSLRRAEGMLRGLGRDMTQTEVVRAVRKEVGVGLSQSYLSQIENGARPHLTKSTRELLARFFKVHPGFLVDDPEGFHTELLSSLPVRTSQLDLWLLEGAQRFRRDAELSAMLEKLGHREDARRSLILLGAILDAPGLASRLLHVLRPAHSETKADREASGRRGHGGNGGARRPREHRGPEEEA